ncbi:hypothetical protein [Microlunatus soli]|uniref:Uncharacterized protein n=1 Tax=Microlunatus soli TaxID=630515 RepID=A0A1H1ZAR3_9ACTN|nr:hypothetical protein [Microlunatus soli]SDT30861.1 hypothetical protein SAMN04489812_5103 [Microlunatus soli]
MTEPLLEDDPILPLQDPRVAPPVRTTEALRQRWRSMMGAGGFGGSTLWMMWFDAHGRQLPAVMPIGNLRPSFDQSWLDNLIWIIDRTAEMGAASVALALSRPGTGSVTDQDRRWANPLIAACSSARSSGALRLTVWPIHLATTNSVRTLSVDDLDR